MRKRHYFKTTLLFLGMTLVALCFSYRVKAQENPYALQTQVIQNQQQLKLLQQQQAQLYLKLDSLLVRYGEIKGELDSINHRLDLIQQQINQLMLSVKQPSTPSVQASTNTKLGNLTVSKPRGGQTTISSGNSSVVKKRLQVTNSNVGATNSNAIPKVTVPKLSPDKKAFNEALALYRQKKYEKAIQAFKKFEREYKNSPLVPEAVFYLAESYYKKGEYDQAIINYDYFVNTYPNNPQVAQATLREGISFIKIGDRVDGNYLLRKVIKKYPNSKEAKEAKEILEGKG